MHNVLFLCVLLVAAPALAMPTPRMGAPVALTGPSVTAGDVFTGLGATDAAFYLAPAPEPGDALPLPASDLLRIARALGLSWRPTTGAEQVVLTNPATVIGAQAIEAALDPALRARGAPADFVLDYAAGPPRLVLAGHGPPPALRVAALSYDPGRGHFSAHIQAGGEAWKVQGQVEPVVAIPALIRGIQAGTRIGPGDLTTLRLPSRSLQRDTLLEAESVAGMTARRALQPGAPLRASDVAPPRLVKRGESVTIVLRDGTLELTALGRALENGAKGDVVRVVNSASGRSLDARVTGDRAVSVGGL